MSKTSLIYLHSILCLAAWWTAQTVVAQTAKSQEILLSVYVGDQITNEPKPKTWVVIMRPDSTVVDSLQTTSAVKVKLRGENIPCGYGAGLTYLPSAGTYLLKVAREGYQTKWQTIVIPAKQYLRRVKDWKATVFMERAPREHTLTGVATVTATRIKMVVKGDTLVYNADAFNLTRGSMLDALIAQLPGFELSREGRITVEGRPVAELLVNGRSFFRGNPKAAMDNLPAYTVNKVKVYRKESEDAYLKKDSLARDAQKRLVVDVNLKKE